MDITDFGTVQDSLKDTLNWTCQLIIDNKSVESALPVLIDLCKIGDTGSVRVANQDHLPKGATYRFSPLLFPGNEYEKIEIALKNASNSGGFKIMKPRAVTKERSRYRGFEVTFICTCGKAYDDKDSRHQKKFDLGDLSQTGIKRHTLQECSKSRDKATMKKKAKVSLQEGKKKCSSKRTPAVTERPLTKDDLCPFKFTVFTDPGYKQWYLATPKKASNYGHIKFGTHLQHTIQQECHIQPSISQMSKDEEAFVYECSTLGLSKKLEKAKGNSTLVYHGSLEKSMEESDCNLEASNGKPEVLAGMLEPTLKTSKQTSLLHEMLEKQVDIVNATNFPDQIELYKEMDNNVKEIIKCVTEPCDVNFVRENLLYITKTLKERHASDVMNESKTVHTS
eukprot:scaffold274190_cov67-Attheya_sp.AAC.1